MIFTALPHIHRQMSRRLIVWGLDDVDEVGWSQYRE